MTPGPLRRRQVPPTLAAVATLATEIAAWADAAGLAPRRRRELLLIHDELASNVVRHSAGVTAIELDLRLDAEGGLVRYRIEDDGAPFDPRRLAAPPTEAPLAERTPGGLGVHFVRTLARDLRWRRVRDRNRTEVELALAGA